MPGPARDSTAFEKIQELEVAYTPQKITQYESSRSGLRVAIIDRQGPKVYGQLAFCTEIQDDSGAPHTLEHLCFLGSKNYPYRGLLDKLAYRAYADGTNAGTAQDYTTYEMNTVGWEPFAQMLPVYLDSVLLPLLTDAACTTEVHHIDGNGHDSGVVYAEMQNYENDAYELMRLHMKRMAYPPGSGYRTDTGGLLPALRVLTTDRIRDYHKLMYHPRNLRIIVTGQVDHDHLLQILDDFERNTIDDLHPAPTEPFRRPFVDSKPCPPLAKTTVDTVQFPEADESMGEVNFGWFGPKYADNLTDTALYVLMEYLVGSRVSVIRNAMVDHEALCSGINHYTHPQTERFIQLTLESVDTADLKKAYNRFLGLLKQTASQPLDMQYMRDCIVRTRRGIKQSAEDTPDFLAQSVREDHMYGNRNGDDLVDLAHFEEFDTLLAWPEQQWQTLLCTWLVEPHHVAVIMNPSASLVEQNEKKEAARVEAQRARLGPDGLKRLEEELKHAREEGNQPVPEEIFDRFPILDVSAVKLVESTTAKAGRARRETLLSDNDYQQILDQDGGATCPGYLHFEHVPSNFINVRIVLSPGEIPLRCKPLLELYNDLLFASAVRREGQLVLYQDVNMALERDTVSFHAGVVPVNGELLEITIQAEVEKYTEVVEWLRVLLFDAEPDNERLQSILTEQLAAIPEEKRQASSMVDEVESMALLSSESTTRATRTLAKSKYYKRIRAMLSAGSDEPLHMLNELRSALHKEENMRITIAGDLHRISNPVSTWSSFFNPMTSTNLLRPIQRARDVLSPTGKAPGNICQIVPIASCDSSFASLSSAGITSVHDADYPALLLAEKILNALTGVFYDATRAQGLAYGVSFFHRRGFALETLSVYSSPNITKVLRNAKQAIADLAQGSAPITPQELEAAVSQIVLERAERAETMAKAATTSFYDQALAGLEKGWNDDLVARVRRVDEKGIRAAIARYMLPIFVPETSKMFVTCAKIMVPDLVSGAREFGFEDPEVRELASYEDDYGLEGPDEDLDEDEDDEDEDDEEEDGDEEMKDADDSESGRC